MWRSSNNTYTLLILSTFWLLAGCGIARFSPGSTHIARAGEETALYSTLTELPPPKEPIVVAVYQFRDQTGQYKASDQGSGFSTAVTQGAANILVKTLEDSKWFAPIERENIGDLLNERKIIRSTRQQFGVTEELPALLYAGVLLEGGIVSYDANVITGGSGLRYFGTGASSQYRQDRVTVYLRAISVSNGKILKTVYASRMVLSQSLDGGIFRYVAFKRLLEAETGFTYNEPSEMAVKEAIEKAVENLIMEGIQDNLWTLKEEKKKKEVLEIYQKEKDAQAKIDLLAQETGERRAKGIFSLSTNHILYKGDIARARLRTGAEIGFGVQSTPKRSFMVQLGLGEWASAGGLKTSVQYADVNWLFKNTPYYAFSPGVQLGGGVVRSEISGKISPKVQAGLHFEWLKNKRLGLKASIDYHYAFSDKLDNLERGKYKDTYWKAGLGVNFYFGQKVNGQNPGKSINPYNTSDKPKGPLRDF